MKRQKVGDGGKKAFAISIREKKTVSAPNWFGPDRDWQ
jgi:hypothetical protein